MKFTNLQLLQRLLRVSAGVFLMAVGWWWSEDQAFVWTVPLRVAALYPLLTGILGWCPVKSLLTERGPSDP